MLFTESTCAFGVSVLERSYRHRARLSHSAHVSWEFICNIGFEYGLLRGRRLWRWTAAVSGPSSPSFSPSLHQSYHIPAVTNGLLYFFFPQIYIACRLCTISQVVIDLVGLSLLHEFDCKVRFSCSLPKSPSRLPPPFSSSG